MSDESAGRRERVFWLVTFALGILFLLRNAHLQLATDDLGWLRGEAPTVFDRYRVIPRFFFVVLHRFLGPMPEAALVMMALFHGANAWLLHALARRLLTSPGAARISLVVFLINPITLSTLTWFSCFSYVLGTTLALLALWTFCQSETPGPGWAWTTSALACYAAGLLCSHELLFLPACFLVLGWLSGRSALRRAVVLCVAALAVAALVNALLYDFGRHGVESGRLASIDFISAWISSVLWFGFSLGIAYPLSFFAPTAGFLQLCFGEPVRWTMTLVLAGGGMLLVRSGRGFRLVAALALCFGALITPYVIRLYLMPSAAGYHISYVLTGRVFYLAFSVVALGLGQAVAALQVRYPVGPRLARLMLGLALLAYGHALFVVYVPADFTGLSVRLGAGPPMPPPWTPYAQQHRAWLLGATLALALVAAFRWRRALSSVMPAWSRISSGPRRIRDAQLSDGRDGAHGPGRVEDGRSGSPPPPRRLFAKRALGEAAALIEEVRGRPQRRLSDLADLPPEKLARLKGGLRPDVPWTVANQAVCLISQEADGSRVSAAVLACTPENLAVFNRINGSYTLGQVADAVAEELGWERERAWSHVTGVFLGLVEKGLCLPTNVVD
jgi:hypothetical protein